MYKNINQTKAAGQRQRGQTTLQQWSIHVKAVVLIFSRCFRPLWKKKYHCWSRRKRVPEFGPLCRKGRPTKRGLVRWDKSITTLMEACVFFLWELRGFMGNLKSRHSYSNSLRRLKSVKLSELKRLCFLRTVVRHHRFLLYASCCLLLC